MRIPGGNKLPIFHSENFLELNRHTTSLKLLQNMKKEKKNLATLNLNHFHVELKIN